MAKFERGKYYSLVEVQEMVPQLVVVHSKNMGTGPVELFNVKGTTDYWIGGPFQGKGTNLFVFLGTAEKPITAPPEMAQFLRIAKEEFKRNAPKITFDDYSPDQFSEDMEAVLTWFAQG